MFFTGSDGDTASSHDVVLAIAIGAKSRIGSWSAFFIAGSITSAELMNNSV
jgi:hypothetical protein